MVDRPMQSKRDRLRQLRAFCAAARFESMTRAAESLAVSQRAVALQVRSLEDELDSRLFDRKGPVLTLTDAGRSLHRLAQTLVEDLDSLADVFAEQRDRPAPTDVEVAVAPVGAVALPHFVKRFVDAHPHVHVCVTNCPLADGLGELTRGRVDAVIGSGPASAEFSYRNMLSYDLVLAMSATHPLAGQQTLRLEHVGAYPAIMPALGTYGRRFEDLVGGRLSVAARVAVESSGWAVLKSFVRAGEGLSVLPDCCIMAKDRILARKLDDLPGDNRCGVFTRAGESPVQTVRDFVQTLARSPVE